jgi:hypothetical protein
MTTVLGIFRDQARALEVIESLRSARFDVDSVRLIGGPSDVASFAVQAGPSARVAAGPPDALLEGLVGSDLPDKQLTAIEQRVQAGAAVLLAERLDSDAARQFAAQLRDHQAEDVISHDPPGSSA